MACPHRDMDIDGKVHCRQGKTNINIKHMIWNILNAIHGTHLFMDGGGPRPGSSAYDMNKR